MNLQENYRQLFKGKARSNDGSILLEARYNVKVKKHQELKSYDDDLEKLRVEYKGTISGRSWQLTDRRKRSNGIILIK